jgi:hypothetical protein
MPTVRGGRCALPNWSFLAEISLGSAPILATEVRSALVRPRHAPGLLRHGRYPHWQERRVRARGLPRYDRPEPAGAKPLHGESRGWKVRVHGATSVLAATFVY